MTRMAYNKANREYYLSHGRCPRCGGRNPILPGYVMCAECKAKHDATQRRRAEDFKARNVCRRCGAPLGDDTHKNCRKCREYLARFRDANNERLRKIYAERKGTGICTRCGKRAVMPGHSYCGICLEKHKAEVNRYDPGREKSKARRQRLQESGRCVDCGKPRNGDNKWRCPTCLARQRDSMQKYRIIHAIMDEADNARQGIYVDR